MFERGLKGEAIKYPNLQRAVEDYVVNPTIGEYRRMQFAKGRAKFLQQSGELQDVLAQDSSILGIKGLRNLSGKLKDFANNLDQRVNPANT